MSISAGPLGLGVGPPLGPSGPLNGPPPSSDQLLLTLRNKPHCRVFRALFQYLPLRDSPNDNPQLELPLNPGDVILVKGEMDSDGFFRGETLDGRTGLVPSNYVERVPDHLILQNARAPSPSFPLSVPAHLTTIQHDFTTEPPDTSHLPDSVCPFPPADVSKVTVQEIKQNDSPRVPCPRDLVVEKKLSRSLVISWSPPEESFVVVSQYHVCVDSSVRAVVPGSYKCRALIEDVALDHSVNVSVRAVTDQGHSPDQSCSIAVGNEAQVAPQHLRVWQVTPVSACVRWHPSNSNAEHVVSLNAVKVGVCPPSVFQVQLSGLTPSTIYRISIRTKHPRAVLEQRPVERCLDFKTLPKIGLPDPPINVQVEHGPQPGHLLVSWTPVCSQPKPPSRAAVASYLVYADGKNIAQVPSETVIADHAVLRLADLSDDPPIFITVRTKTKEGAVSADSNVARVPRGSYTEPLLTAAPLTLDPMASSYPSYAQPAYATPNPYIGPMSGPTAATVQPMPGFWNPNVPTMIPVEAVPSAPVAPYSAPTMMTAMPFQANPLTSYATANTIQGYSAAAPTYDGTLSRMGTLTRGAGLATTATIPVQSALQTTSHTGTLQGTLPKWKTPQSMSQYYTFHPRLLRADGSAEDARPSVLEMENSYLLRHRQNEWTGPTADGRTRTEIYARGGIRAGSAEERMPAAGGRARLVPPRLARVRSETGFGTRSEPDLRPPTLDDDCRCSRFVALFDYSHHMSPNANAEQEELSFRKHQLIKVYGEADGDGFYQGQIGNRYGLVPSNMVIEIAKNDLLPPYKTTYNRGEPMLAAEPALRRMRWGSLKSRSYDHAGDRRREAERPGTMYSSLDRRDPERREPPQRDRYRRANGRDYEYRRDYDDRYREASRDRREEYYLREEDDYREREKYRYESRDRRDERRDERRDDRRGEYEERRRREDDRYRRDRRDEGYREDRSFDYADKTRTGYDQGPGRPASQLTHMPGQSGPSGYGTSQMPGQQMGMGHLTSQMSQMHLQQGMGMQQQMPMEARMNGVHTQQQPSKHMIAKFDYDSRQLSPNADAEQTELSFKQGDMIAIYGEMDEDGFYMGELNGLKGLVPSNFLSEEPLTHLLPAMPAEQIMQRKGVAFLDGQLTSQAIPTAAPVKKAPTRQSSQTSTTPATNNISAGKPTAKKSTAGQGTGAKTLAKKTSDVGKKGDGVPAVRKTSTAVKKSDSTAKKKN